MNLAQVVCAFLANAGIVKSGCNVGKMQRMFALNGYLLVIVSGHTKWYWIIIK